MNINLNNIACCRFVCVCVFTFFASVQCTEYTLCRNSRLFVLLITAAAVVISYRIFEYACLLNIHTYFHIGLDWIGLAACVRVETFSYAIE